MTTKRRSSAARSGARSKRSTANRTTARRSGPTRRRTTTQSRRRTSTATTLGAGVGTVVVAFLLGAPWSVRIALVVLLVVACAGYLVWSRRS